MSKLDIKRIAAVGCAAALMSSLSACGQNTTWGVEIDGSQVPAGVFIAYLQNAYYSAQSKLSEQTASSEETAVSGEEETTTTPALFESLIDGISSKQWIYNEATASMQEYVAVNNKFEEYGLAVSDDDKKIVDLYCEQYWDYYGDYYTEMGISRESFSAMQLNSTKRDLLFEHLYSEGGEKAVSADEIKAYLSENYALISYVDIELKDEEGNLLKSEGKAERMAAAEAYAERLRSGENESAEENDEADEDTTADDTTAEDTTAAEDAEEVSEEEKFDAAIESNKQVINKESTVPSADAVNEVFSTMANGEVKILESADGEHYYIVMKYDILENDEYYESAKESLLYEMKSDEYDELVKAWTESQTVTKNQEAYDRYDPEKIFAAK